MEAIRASDCEKGVPEWVPPAPIHPTFWELLEAPLGDAVPEEETVVEPWDGTAAPAPSPSALVGQDPDLSMAPSASEPEV